MRTKIPIPDHVLMQVQKVFEDYPHSEKTMSQIAKESGFNMRTLYNRASELGFTNKSFVKWVHWSDKEKEIVETNRTMSDRSISKKLMESGYKRTDSQVMSYKRKYKITWNNGDKLSSVQVAEGLGVHHSTVYRWIKNGKLKGGKIDITLFVETKPFLIKPKNLKLFLIEHIDIINLKSVDKYFLVNILTGKL